MQNPWNVCQRFGRLGECRSPSTCADAACAVNYAQNNFLPMPSRPLPPHVPLRVIPQMSRFDAEKSVTFIGGQLCLFENDEPPPPPGVEIEVMATRPLYRQLPDNGDGQGERFDFTALKAILLRAVSPKWQLVQHEGFESGSDGRCLARVPLVGTEVITLTPGRSQVVFAKNVLAGKSNRVQYQPKQPGWAWVERDAVKRALTAQSIVRPTVRVEGISNLEHAQYRDAIASPTGRFRRSN